MKIFSEGPKLIWPWEHVWVMQRLQIVHSDSLPAFVQNRERERDSASKTKLSRDFQIQVLYVLWNNALKSLWNLNNTITKVSLPALQMETGKCYVTGKAHTGLQHTISAWVLWLNVTLQSHTWPRHYNAANISRFRGFTQTLLRHTFSHSKTCFKCHASIHANHLGEEEKVKRTREILFNSMHDIDVVSSRQIDRWKERNMLHVSYKQSFYGHRKPGNR